MGTEEMKKLGLDPDEIRIKLDQIMEWNELETTNKTPNKRYLEVDKQQIMRYNVYYDIRGTKRQAYLKRKISIRKFTNRLVQDLLVQCNANFMCVI